MGLCGRGEHSLVPHSSQLNNLNGEVTVSGVTQQGAP
jgi:hypothetical protein